jgi:hypothetical protein
MPKKERELRVGARRNERPAFFEQHAGKKSLSIYCNWQLNRNGS